MTQTPNTTPFREVPLEPGFHFLATPIGSARDITLRALDVLASADVIAAEDTRTTRHLMDLHGVPLRGRPMIAYHDHNGEAQRPRLLALAREGRSIAYASEAGTPLVADPGYQLARAAIAEGLPVTSAPGPSAVLAALTLSGLPSDRFLFAGFPPASGGARKTWISGLAEVEATLVMFESPKRIGRLLGELAQAYGPDRKAALCRELTKKFEEVARGPLSDLADWVAERTPKGEMVLVVDRPGPRQLDPEAVDADLRAALVDMPVKQAAAEVAERHGLKRRDVYQAALKLRNEDGNAE
jgi:16S rRNA (cytidine1402-2'-O)-methyltransferase